MFVPGSFLLFARQRHEDDNDDGEESDDEPVLPTAAVPPADDSDVLRGVHESLRRLRRGWWFVLLLK